MEVKHKDHEITYRESSNDWFSPEVGIKPSLAAAKKAIDDLLRKGRRADIKALWIRENYWGKRPIELLEVTIGAMSEPNHGRPITQAWITYERASETGRSKVNEREKVTLSSLYAPSDRAKLEEYMRLNQAAKDAEAAAEKFKGGLAGLTAEAINALKGGEPK